MINLMKMNIYRMFKEKIFYIMLFATIVLDMFMWGIYILEHCYSTGTWIDEFTIGSGTPLLLGIFIAQYNKEETVSGFRKNYTVGIKYKSCVYVSKIVNIVIFIICQNIVDTVLMSVIHLLSSIPFQMVSVSEYLIIMLSDVMMISAMGALLLLISELSRKKFAVYCVVVIILGKRITLLLNLMKFRFQENDVSDKITNMVTTLSRCLLQTRMYELGPGLNISTHMYNIILGLIWLVVYTYLGVLVYTKRDVV